MQKGRKVKVKAECCKSSPRCKRCPRAWRRLERAGSAERRGKRRFVLVADLSKSEWKAARAR